MQVQLNGTPCTKEVGRYKSEEIAIGQMKPEIEDGTTRRRDTGTPYDTSVLVFQTIRPASDSREAVKRVRRLITHEFPSVPAKRSRRALTITRNDIPDTLSTRAKRLCLIVN